MTQGRRVLETPENGSELGGWMLLSNGPASLINLRFGLEKNGEERGENGRRREKNKKRLKTL